MDEVPKQFSYMNQTGGSTGRQTGVYNYIRLYQYSDFITGADGELILKPELPQPYQKVYPGDAMYADLNGDHIVDGNDKSVAGYATRPEYVFGWVPRTLTECMTSNTVSLIRMPESVVC